MVEISQVDLVILADSLVIQITQQKEGSGDYRNSIYSGFAQF